MPKTRTVVAFGDVHFPFADATALKLLQKVLRATDPDEILCLGDLIDCYSISRFERNPSRKIDLAFELDQGRKFLAGLRRSFPSAKITFLLGNHEDRLRKFLWTRAPELASLPSLKLENLLGLEDIGIDWRDYGAPYEIAPGFVGTHGTVVRGQSGASARGEMTKHGCGGISGHVHRLGICYETKHSGARFWIEAGCLCSLDPEYAVGPVDWQQGCVVLTIVGGQVTPEVVPFQGGRAVFRGKVL